MFGTMFAFLQPKNPNKWVGLVLASLALAIVIIDGTVLNVSQSAIINSIGVSSSQIKSLEGFLGLQWATTLYSLIVAAFTIWGGRIADKYGKKNIFLIGAGLFALGSLITALSYHWGVVREVGGFSVYGIQILILGWSVIEGIGAAMMLPATISLIVSNFEGKERSTAFGIWGATAGFSAAIGPLLGGFFTTYFNWSWAFLINVFVVAILMLLSGNIVDKSVRVPNLKIDYTSVALSALGIASVTYGLIESSTYGWWKAEEAWVTPFGNVVALPGALSVTPYAVILGLILLVLFVYRQVNLKTHSKNPLVDLSLFKSQQFSVGLISLIFFSIAFSSLLFALPLFLQVILGKDAFQSGLAFLPFSLASLVMAPISGFLANKYSPKYIVMVGVALNAVGLFWLGTQLSVDWNTMSFVLPFIVMGAGGGLAQAQLGNLTLSDITGRQSGEASGVQSAVRQLGQTLSTALVGSVFVTVLATAVAANINSISPAQLPEGGKEIYTKIFSETQPLYGISPAEQQKASDAASKLITPGTTASETLQKEAARFVPVYVVDKVKLAAVEASKSALLAGAVAAVISLIATLFFHDIKSQKHGIPKQTKVASGH